MFPVPTFPSFFLFLFLLILDEFPNFQFFFWREKVTLHHFFLSVTLCFPNYDN